MRAYFYRNSDNLLTQTMGKMENLNNTNVYSNWRKVSKIKSEETEKMKNKMLQKNSVNTQNTSKKKQKQKQ